MATKKTTKKSSSKSAPRRSAPAPRVCCEPTISEDYRPITMWGYFGYEFLFAIPVVGWVICVAFALMAQNHNLRNFARSKFCWLIIYIVVFCVLAGVGALSTVFRAFGLI